MTDSLAALKARLARIKDLHAAAAVLDWDQETMMPSGSTEARARQTSTLQELAHELFTSDETGALLEIAVPGTEIEKDLVRVVTDDFRKARRIPADLVARFARETSLAREGWQAARQADEFDRFEPHLARIVDLCVERAEALGYKESRYDALIDEFEPGMTTAGITSVFGALRAELVPIVRAIAEANPEHQTTARVLRRHFPVDRQRVFAEKAMADIGYDFRCGRQDESSHPFTTSFSITDVRVTTRYEIHHFPSALFGSLHEAGHGMYEQGIDPELEGTPLADGTSLGMHESQSRFWENQVGRSRAFWDGRFPSLKDLFPAALQDQTAESFWRAVNHVAPSLIRVEADEVTYNLHIMLRFEIEKQLIGGTLKAKDVPEAWNALTTDFLGLTPPNDADGCLQDIHWSSGILGYFPTYALGNLMSAQLWNAATRDLGDLDELVRLGEFAPILGWMRKRVHRWGRRRTANEILQETTGGGLDAEPWLAYVRKKYGGLYGLEL